jgi:carboxyl-terminal processing protease
MYYRVTGDSTQNRGVQPDIRLPSAISLEEVGESSRDGALPWNRIRPADFKRLDALTPLVEELQLRHAERVAGNPDFQHASEEIAALEEMRSHESVSLNLEKRKAEREQRAAEQLARENARREAQGLPTLENASDIEDVPDALLAETAEITADLSRLEPRYLARRSGES